MNFFIAVDSDKLQCLNLSIISDRDCNKSYPGLITASMFCAGYLEGGKGVCRVMDDRHSTTPLNALNQRQTLH